MNKIPPIEQIEAFLAKAKYLIEQQRIDFIYGSEEKYTLGQLGVSIEDAFLLIKDLSYQNYYRGPSPDHKFTHEEVWEFGVEEEPDDLYIKCKFRERKSDLLMLSFHFAQRPIHYPYK